MNSLFTTFLFLILFPAIVFCKDTEPSITFLMMSSSLGFVMVVVVALCGYMAYHKYRESRNTLEFKNAHLGYDAL